MKIRFENVLERGERMYRITGFENVIEYNDLPEKYTAKGPAFWKESGVRESIWTKTADHIHDSYAVGDKITVQKKIEFDSLLVEAGKRLRDINKNIETQNRDWVGKTTVSTDKRSEKPHGDNNKYIDCPSLGLEIKYREVLENGRRYVEIINTSFGGYETVDYDVAANKLDLCGYKRVVNKGNYEGVNYVKIKSGGYAEDNLYPPRNEHMKRTVPQWNELLDDLAIAARHKAVVDRFLKKEKNEYGNRTRSIKA